MTSLPIMFQMPQKTFVNFLTGEFIYYIYILPVLLQVIDEFVREKLCIMYRQGF